ncbi:TPA: hypothetical protein ACUAF5_004334 [Escherichia coli]
MDSPETELAKSASFSLRLTCVDSRHNPFSVFAACTALSAVPGILSATTRLCRFFATGTCSYDGTAASFPVPEGVSDATATSRTTTGAGRRHALRTQTVFNDNTDRPRDACPPFLHAGQLSRGGTTRQQVSFPSGACPGQPQPLAQGTSFPPSASAGLAIMNKN